MNSSICISGLALWICGLVFFMVVFLIALLGCAYLKDEKKICRLERRNKSLLSDLDELNEQLYKMSFKVPNTDKDYEDKFPVSEMGGSER